METLPSLAVTQICSYLPLPDLLACSLVSVSWRSAINSDYVWNNVCLKTSNKTTIDFVQTENSTVAPTFQELENTTLEPLCHWRIVFMKLQHISRNWRRANHTAFKVTDNNGDFVAVQKYNDTFVAIDRHGDCGVWNIRGVPRKQQSLPLALEDTCRYDCFIHLKDDLLVIVQDTLLQVYKKVNNTFVLFYKRLFNLPEQFSIHIPSTLTVDDWYNGYESRKKLTSFNAMHVIGKFFIGLDIMSSCKDYCLHVWDTVTGSKLKEELISNLHLEDDIQMVQIRPPRTYLDKVLVSVQYCRIPFDSNTSPQLFTIVYLYDFSYLTFKKLNVMSTAVLWIFYEDTFFLTVDHSKKILSTFNSTSGKMICSQYYKEVMNPTTVQVCGDYLGCVTKNGLVIKNIKQNFKSVFKTTNQYCGYYGIEFINCDLILVTSYDSTNKVEIWSIQEKKLLSSLVIDGEIGPCDNFTNLFICELGSCTTIKVLKFW